MNLLGSIDMPKFFDTGAETVKPDCMLFQVVCYHSTTQSMCKFDLHRLKSIVSVHMHKNAFACEVFSSSLYISIYAMAFNCIAVTSQ